jgi:hypothetical protein
VKASDPGVQDSFGAVIALSGETLLVGAPLEDSSAVGVDGAGTNVAASDSGAAYVFVRDQLGLWSQEAYLKASNTDPEDRFGTGVAISGDLLAIGAPYESSNAIGVDGDQANNSKSGAGAVYVFARDALGQWIQEAYIKPSNTAARSNFGETLALEGNTLVVGAPDSDLTMPLVYVFTRDEFGTWSEQAVLTGSGSVFGFARALALQGDTLAVGSRWYPGMGDIDGFSGAVYVFEREDGNWQETALLQGSNTERYDRFGVSVALSNNTLVVGAGYESSASTAINGDQDDNSASESGAVYVFEQDADGNWSQSAYIKASNAESPDHFGESVALSGDWLAVAAPIESSSATGINGVETDNSYFRAGAGYLFERDLSGQWSQALYLKASNANADDFFGRSLALSNSKLIFSAPFERSNAAGINGDSSNNNLLASGAVYIFE